MAKKEANRGQTPLNVPVKAAPNLRIPSNINILPRNAAIAPPNTKNMIALEFKSRDDRKMNVSDHSVIVLTNKVIMRPEATVKVKRPFLLSIICVPHNIAAQMASNSEIISCTQHTKTSHFKFCQNEKR